MCGISGIFGRNKIDQIFNLVKAQDHRGPDSSAVIFGKYFSLGFNRLSIIDLHHRAMQPFISNDKKKILVFNGEIYNYKKIKEKYFSKYKFKTKSDTEVLMASLERWGINALSKIFGMFAFCYIDQEKNEAYLARDRFGQKPLYFSKMNDGFVFASEIKAILSTGINTSPNYKEILRFVNFSQYDNGKKTLFKNISQLNSGDYIKYNLKNNKYNIYNWYDLEKETAKTNFELKTYSSEKVYEKLKHLLSEVCLEHSISDVPISLSLSGGLDSSTILASLVNSNKKFDIRCNLIDFHGGFSEEKFVKELTRKYNQRYFVNTYSKKNFIDNFENLIFKQEGFIAGLHNIAFENLYKHLSKNRMKVLLDGTGLDESFGGYRVHQLHYLSNLRINNHDLFDIKAAEFCKTWKISLKNLLKSINLVKNDKNLSIDGSIINNPSLLDEHLLKREKSNKFIYKNLKKHYFDFIKNTKIPRNLRIKDRHSMSYSIETRLPFMDHRLVEFGLNFKSDEIFKFGFTKFPIRKIMENKIPHQVLYSQKRDIQNPQTSWFRQRPIYDFIHDCISSRSFKERGFYDYKKTLKLIKSFKEKGAENSFFILQWLNVEIWHQVYQDQLQKNLENLLAKYKNKKINLIKNEKKYL